MDSWTEEGLTGHIGAGSQRSIVLSLVESRNIEPNTQSAGIRWLASPDHTMGPIAECSPCSSISSLPQTRRQHIQVIRGKLGKSKNTVPLHAQL